jgi:hypothetical protein
MLDVPAMITTKAVRDVITIADIEALEGPPTTSSFRPER